MSDASGGTIDATVIVTKSFSELAPIDCNSSLAGRDRNRRVEIWVRDHLSAPKLAGKEVDKTLFDATDESIAKAAAAAKPAKAAAPSIDGASAAIAKPQTGTLAGGVVKKKKKAAANAVAVDPAAANANATPSLTDLLTSGTAEAPAQ